MLSREVLRQVRRLQFRARRSVEGLLGGAYHSAFKGSGLAFAEVREYQVGDDVRSIDWNVTARAGHPFIKRYLEERELTVILAVDVSASQGFGTQARPKQEVAAELAAVLAFSALANHDRVGLLQFSDRVERFVPPRHGTRHVLRIIRDILYSQASHPRTSLQIGLDFLNRVLRRRAVVFLFSDFLDSGYERAYRHAGRRHDLVAIRLTDPREEELPAVGLLELEDPETGRQILVDTNNARVRASFRQLAEQRRTALAELNRRARSDLFEASTDGGHLDALLRFLRARERRMRRV